MVYHLLQINTKKHKKNPTNNQKKPNKKKNINKTTNNKQQITSSKVLKCTLRQQLSTVVIVVHITLRGHPQYCQHYQKSTNSTLLYIPLPPNRKCTK